MSQISASLTEFLQKRVSSAEQIDVLLLLRQGRERSWTASDVAAALGTASESAGMRLFLLASSGLITFEPTATPQYRFAPLGDADEAALDDLAGIWILSREMVVAIVEKRPSDPVRSFADAFKLRK